MSSDPASRKKRTPPDQIPAPEGDHRRRRRNRTTQSCLNCHTSKRMCDRKRPACARCTQLGLTGLCIYEVDDPSQQQDTQDESSRLLKRVAELESVIRELKNKPHPRWTQSGGSGGEYDKLLPRPGTEACPSNFPSSPGLSSDSLDNSGSGGDSVAPVIRLQSPNAGDTRTPFSPASPIGGSSTGLATPTDNYAYSRIGTAGPNSLQDYDFASMFLNYPELMTGPDSGTPPSVFENRYTESGSHCGCVQDQSSYNTMLELSLRLRKATDVLSRYPNHQMGGFCHLHQRVSELDLFTANALSDNVASHSDRLHPAIQGHFLASQMYTLKEGPPSSCSIQTGPWNFLPSGASSPPSIDDFFMSWKRPRRG